MLAGDLFVETVGNGSSDRLVDDSRDVHAGDGTGILRGLVMLQLLRKAGMVTAALLTVVPSYNSAAASSISRRTMEGALSRLEDRQEGRAR
jgi:hypothetical protein